MTQQTFNLTGLRGDQLNMLLQGLSMVQREAQSLAQGLQASAEAQIAAMQMQAPTVEPAAPPASEAPTA